MIHYGLVTEMKKRISIEDAKEGDVLASDIILPSGLILITKDTQLNEYILKRMSHLGVKNIEIFKPQEEIDISGTSYGFHSSYKNLVTETKRLFQDLAVGKNLDLKKVVKISDTILDHIDYNDHIMKYLMEVNSTDEYTYNHCIKTAFYSMMIAKWLKMKDQDIRKAMQSGLLHDIGKTKIPSEVLDKKGSLTSEEFEIIKKHPNLGYEMLRDIDEIDNDIKTAVLLHHERIDGSGYPYHYNNNKLSIFAKIVALADVYDAMTSDRVYKKKVTPFDVIEMYMTIGISQFDTGIMNAFCKQLSVHLVGANVLLSNGDMGKIVYIPTHNLTCPVLKIDNGYLDLCEQKSIHILSFI